MSEFFVKKFNQKTKCGICKTSKLKSGGKVYSLCLEHLDEARSRWRRWAKERRNVGRCISCDCKSLNGWLRCRKHTKINRERCKHWARANKEHISKCYKQRTEEWILQGLCICSKHNPLDGYRRCKPCRTKNQNRKKNWVSSL